MFSHHVANRSSRGYRQSLCPCELTKDSRSRGLQAALEEGIRALVVTPRAHNPTGAVISAERARDLTALLANYPHVLIVEDDHFWQVSGHQYRSIIPEGHPRWALVRSVSKSLGPDLRVGIVGSDRLTAARLAAHIRSGAMWVSHLLQRLTFLLTSHPDTPRQLAHAAAEYARANARAWSHKTLAAKGNYSRPPQPTRSISSINPDELPAAPIVAALAEYGWLVRDGAEFSFGRHRQRRHETISASRFTSSPAGR